MSRLDRIAAAALGLGLLGLVGCPGPADGTSATRSPARNGEGKRVISDRLVGNQASGIDDQPDYDRAALEIRERVSGRLPDPLPSQAGACRAMIDAAISHYREKDGPDAPAVATLAATRAADERGCVAQTGAAAATCVTVLLAEGAGEFPWLLDQCTRAFPKRRGGA